MNNAETNPKQSDDEPAEQEEFSHFCKKFSLKLVKGAYRGILDREADKKGLEHYAQGLNSGDALVKLLRTLVESAEHRERLLKPGAEPKFDTKDIFNGILPGDLQRVSALCDSNRETDPALFIDAIGVRVSPHYYPWIANRLGTRHIDTPIPNDSYFAEGIEYVALALAFEQAQANEQFTVVEIGAGWGPWLSASGVIAQRKGYKTVNLIGFEADEERFNAMRAHLELNGLVPIDAASEGTSEGVHWKLLNVAADAQKKLLYWPISHGIEDAGMVAVAEQTSGVDYRGKITSYKEIPTLDIRESLIEYPVIDFMHIDIQGGESELVRNTLSFLEERVRCLFIGTHSRKIEGDLVSDLRLRGWSLLRERPCQFALNSEAPTLTGMTYVDGGQFWRPPSR